MLKFCLFLILILPCLANAAFFSRENFKEIDINFGTHTEFYDNVQINDTGAMRKFEFAPIFGIGLPLDYNEHLKIIPEFNWVLPTFIENQKIMINTFMFRGDLAVDPLKWLRLRFGTSIIVLNQQGRGGSKITNNGNTQTRFYYPDSNQSSINNTLDLAGEILVNSLSFRLQTYTYSAFDKDHRQISYTLIMTYHWEQE